MPNYCRISTLWGYSSTGRIYLDYLDRLINAKAGIQIEGLILLIYFTWLGFRLRDSINGEGANRHSDKDQQLSALLYTGGFLDPPGISGNSGDTGWYSAAERMDARFFSHYTWLWTGVNVQLYTPE
jgi:hypothetical protein